MAVNTGGCSLLIWLAVVMSMILRIGIDTADTKDELQEEPVMIELSNLRLLEMCYLDQPFCCHSSYALC